jgi:hypothetical protein
MALELTSKQSRRARDKQVSAAYNAESAVRAYMRAESMTIEEARKFLDEVWPGIKLIFIRGEKGWWRGTERQIELPHWGRSELTILHEVAHSIVEGISRESHGRLWAATFLLLVTFYIGLDAARLLQLAYDAAGVEHVVFKSELEPVKEKMLRVYEAAELSIAASERGSV